MITLTTVDLVHVLRVLQEAKSTSLPDGHGGWTVYRLVPDAEIRDFVAKTGASLSPVQEQTYARG